MTPSSHYLACEGRELHVTEWGAGQPEVVVAWHGQAYQLAFYAALPPVAGLGCTADPGAGAARCAQRPAAARGGRGHAPTLNTPEQCRLVERFVRA